VKKSKWPKWAPSEAIDYCESIFGLWGAAELELLLTDKRAATIWPRLHKANIGADTFCKAFIAAYDFPESNKSPAEFKKHLDKIAKKSYELALLIDEVPSINTIFQCQHLEKMRNGFDYRYYPANVVQMLMFISDTAEQHSLPLCERPNTENAFVIFFIKSMDDFFRQKTSKPYTSITLLCVELLFPDYQATKKTIEKTTAKTPTKTRKNLK